MDRNLFNVNPYAPPESLPVASIEKSLASARSSLLICFVAAIVGEVATTLVMIVFHDRSPQIRGANLLAIVQLFITLLLAASIAWMCGLKLAMLKAHSAAQISNILLWTALVMTILFGSRFGIPDREYWVFAAGCSAGSVLSCTATFLAPRVFPRRGL